MGSEMCIRDSSRSVCESISRDIAIASLALGHTRVIYGFASAATSRARDISCLDAILRTRCFADFVFHFSSFDHTISQFTYAYTSSLCGWQLRYGHVTAARLIQSRWLTHRGLVCDSSRQA